MIYTGRQTVFNHSEQQSLARLIQNEDEIAVNKREEGKTSFAFRLAKYLFTSGVGDILETLNVILSLGMTILFAINTYYYPDSPDIIGVIEFGLIWFFIIHFLLNVYISENKFMFLMGSYYSILEYVSIIPTFLVSVGTIRSSDLVTLTQIIRFLLIGKLDKILARYFKEGARQIFKLVFCILSIVMIGASCLLIFERGGGGNYQFHDWFYFMVVTVSVVGFGDVYPRTSLGQVFVILSILALLAFLPPLTQELARTFNLQSKYARISYKTLKAKHILLLGCAEIEAFKTFLAEFYHKDHGDNDIQTLIMQTRPPNEEMQNLLKSQMFSGKVSFIEGNALSNKDLERAAADTADCAIILSNKSSTDADSEDYRNILQAFSVKQFVQSVRQKEIRVCVQVLKPENKDLFTSSPNFGPEDQIICVDELKLYLLAKTCVCPGINTIISPLITSNTPEISNTNLSFSSWIPDYFKGLGNEIYRIRFSKDQFTGYTFSVVAQHIYQNFGIILFAIEVRIGDSLKVFLNPADFIFDDSHHGYVIADMKPDEEKLSKFRFTDQIEKNYTFYNLLGKHSNDPGDEKFRKRYNIDTKDEEQNEIDNKMKSFYFGKINSLESATLNGVDDPKFENHIIICGIVPGMRHLLNPLRTRSLKSIHPIIILYNDPMPTNIWKQINRFPKVYFLQGSTHKPQDLDKACIQKALAVIILSKHSDQESNSTTMADADTIFIYKTIKSRNPTIRIITELTSTSTISFLSPSKNENMLKYGYMATEPFASGEIYISTMLDTLISQAYYNQGITSIFDQLIMGNMNMRLKFKKMCNQLKLTSCTLFIMNVPVKFIDKTFKEMFETLITESKMIVIGLYREKNKGGRYVYIKPDPTSVKLTAKDKVYVLSPKQPKNAEMANIEEEEQSNMARTLADGLPIHIKSKLGGEEGKYDADVARDLLKIHAEVRGIVGDLKSINSEVFSKGFTDEDFVPEVRSTLRKELGEFTR